MLNLIDGFLNRITMYRLVLYYLAALFVVALAYTLLGILPYGAIPLLFSAAVITAVCWGSNLLFARVFGAVRNAESVYITALILALIITPVPPTDAAGIGFLAFASVWAMASKYAFTRGKRHLFNPAAFGVAASALVIGHSATWWVGGNIPLLPFVLVGGLLVVRKLRRFDLVGSFALAAFATMGLTGTSGNYFTPIEQALLHAPLLFFAFVMLTEPLTTPPTRPARLVYGAFTGLLFAPSVHVGSLYSTPELALLVGNACSYLMSRGKRYLLTLTAIKKAAENVYDFLFEPDGDIRFEPGQYMEWTVRCNRSDSRGNRRYFTIASSPTEDAVRLGVKFYPRGSAFKHGLASLKVGDKISASHIAGGFTLPKNPKKKLVFIAGGIGATPFRSMVQYLLDTERTRDIAFFYSNKTVGDIAYKDVFDRAHDELGMKIVYAVTDEKTAAPDVYNGPVNARLIVQQVPDYRRRTFYISGPRALVESFRKTLRELGVPRFRIKTDFFPGFA